MPALFVLASAISSTFAHSESQYDGQESDRYGFGDADVVGGKFGEPDAGGVQFVRAVVLSLDAKAQKRLIVETAVQGHVAFREVGSDAVDGGGKGAGVSYVGVHGEGNGVPLIERRGEPGLGQPLRVGTY